MNCKFLAVSSVTYALKGKSELAAFGIQSSVQKLEELSDTSGCGYGIRVNSGDSTKALGVLKKAGIGVISVKNCVG